MKAGKKELIREAAVKVIAETGFHSATTDKIAAEAGISVGTIYNYFRNKEEVLEYIFTVELNKRKDFYNSLRDRDGSIVGQIGQLLTMHFAAVQDNPAVGQILVRERHLSEKEQLQAVQEFIDGIPLTLQKLLERAIHAGEIRQCDTRIVAAAIFGAVEAVVRNAVFQDDHDLQREVLESAPQELLTFFIEGLATK